MSQDPNGRLPATGNVVRGEVITDDQGNVVPPTMPMTEFQRVASGDREDRPQDSETDPDAPGFVRGRHAADETSPEDAVAVRSPDADDRDYWDDDPDEADETDEAGPVQAADAAAEPDVDAADATAEPDVDAADATAEPDADAADATADEVSLPGDADAPATAPAGTLRPGESDGALADFRDLTFGSLLPDGAEFRARWQQVQFRFVDDPQGSVTEAADVISQVTAQLEAAIAERQRAIAERQRALRDRWSEGMSADTESLRGTLLMYRAFLDQLAGSDGRVS